jgi:expansin (peptidoglycan-binding protein)
MTGQGTWYDTGLTACGVTNTDNQFIAAVSEILFDGFPGATANPNNNPVCNKQAEVTYQGKTITVTITDRCTACKPGDLDFTPTAFAALADIGIGRISGIEWHFIN